VEGVIAQLRQAQREEAPPVAASAGQAARAVRESTRTLAVAELERSGTCSTARPCIPSATVGWASGKQRCRWLSCPPLLTWAWVRDPATVTEPDCGLGLAATTMELAERCEKQWLQKVIQRITLGPGSSTAAFPPVAWCWRPAVQRHALLLSSWPSRRSAGRSARVAAAADNARPCRIGHAGA